MIGNILYNILRRKDTCAETLNLNRDRLKSYINKMILFPRRGKLDKKPKVPEATKEKLSTAEASFQNTTKAVVPLPQKEAGFGFVSMKDLPKDFSAYKTLRKELKTQKGFYKRLEDVKKKNAAAASKK